jgi:hypothetical protein
MEKLANRSNGLGQADIGGMPCALARHPVRKAKKQRSAIAPKNEAMSILENLAIREILQIDGRESHQRKAIRLDFQGRPVSGSRPSILDAS